jgi:hypothetical protein
MLTITNPLSKVILYPYYYNIIQQSYLHSIYSRLNLFFHVHKIIFIRILFYKY